ncbi:hypothetical protein HWC66_gp05 [Gordonia phage Chikenjars]|uniref:Uncharacterized protein n=1 Tax=Gordonia phage Chikenjars TaxID=2601686 RepID=A0A5J6D8Y3_9CAUD|nr:hypothetical protein HWC66_gp05 [Gordonia phage Chikenjars]QEQ94309.1 hypothetical protein SEA_CHIKENJARS_5 [Gordonia phage Chikenjars]QXO14029.1 hypothetical protein SEA_ALAINAMARIE_5 [Gordonia phage AlainaMarie]QYC53932.1 hypothetical protein SEA_NITHYA_5 [Gordonia phage Nithya]WNN94326.1 hypothetical protein SEA_ENDAVE_5 [Gordonia phage EndAve]
MSTALLDFLEHHGVKGMRWGVRKERKAIVSNMTSAANEIRARQDANRWQSSMNETTYNSLSDKDFVVGKDAVLRRTTKNLEGDLMSEHTYLSINDADAARYRGLLPAALTGVQKSYEQHYESTYEATGQLKSPSEKKRVDAYIALMDKEAIELSDGSKLTGREYLKQIGLGDVVDTMGSKELTLTYYGQLVANQGIRDDPINTAYFNEIKSKGYNALVDDNDRGIYSETPLVILNQVESVKRVGVKQLTDADIHEAQGSLRPPDRLARNN